MKVGNKLGSVYCSQLYDLIQIFASHTLHTATPRVVVLLMAWVLYIITMTGGNPEQLSLLMIFPMVTVWSIYTREPKSNESYRKVKGVVTQIFQTENPIALFLFATITRHGHTFAFVAQTHRQGK